MRRKIATVLLFGALVAFATVLATGTAGRIPSGGIPSVWFYSGLVTLIFAVFYIEPHFNAPRNVLAHSVTVLLVCLSSRDTLAEDGPGYPYWRWLFLYAGILFFLSWMSLVLENREGAPDSKQNRIAAALSLIATKFGAAKLLYSGVFLVFLPIVHDLKDPWVIATLVFWWTLVITEPANVLSRTLDLVQSPSRGLAEIFSVQSGGVFLARAFKTARALQVLDPVQFRFELDANSSTVRRGVVVDRYTLHSEQWVRIVELERAEVASSSDSNIVVEVEPSAASGLIAQGEELVGLVCENSDVRTLRFEVRQGSPPLEEGALVECPLGEDRVYYQLLNGITATERLEDRSESGFIRGEALQLGRWDSKRGCFWSIGWVPEVSAPVKRAALNADQLALAETELELGRMPAAELPVPIDLEKARSHHMAILGVTGAGKTFITLKLIESLAATTKVICVDFTGEYVPAIEDQVGTRPRPLIHQDGMEEVEETLALKKDASKKNALDYQRRIDAKLFSRMSDFMDSEDRIAMLELPNLSNTSFILEFTQAALDAVFRYAKEYDGQNICLILEEAHTVIPETTYLGDLGDYSANKALVNKMSQIALQGRKYGVGLWVIAQRTANVSKTVLTQCNSLLCFRAFDETSMRFLESHLGREVARTIPRLKRYHAIAVGKAFRGDVPTIVDLERRQPGSSG